jgi:hypothetical protein
MITIVKIAFIVKISILLPSVFWDYIFCLLLIASIFVLSTELRHRRIRNFCQSSVPKNENCETRNRFLAMKTVALKFPG